MDVKQAVRQAAVHFAELVNLPPEVLLLEEVESIREGNETSWCVTFSFPARQGKNAFSFAALGGEREYKTIEITDAGEFKAMKTKELVK